MVDQTRVQWQTASAPARRMVCGKHVYALLPPGDDDDETVYAKALIVKSLPQAVAVLTPANRWRYLVPLLAVARLLVRDGEMLRNVRKYS